MAVERERESEADGESGRRRNKGNEPLYIFILPNNC